MQSTKSSHSSGRAQLRCIACGAGEASLGADFRCKGCGDLFTLEYPAWKEAVPVLGDAERCKSQWRQRKTSDAPADQSGVWRFRELLPDIGDLANIVTLREGNTPLYELPRCARAAGLEQLWAKHQGMNPTGSFKDTGMTAALSVAKTLGYEWVACASTGNTSASMAAYAARAGMKSLVLIPEGRISWGKLSQSLEYGALTCQLRTDFDGCLAILSEVVSTMPVYLLNSLNPYRLEGQKTAAVELLEQWNWRVPDHVVVPGGNLGNSSALGKMFVELRELGFIGKLPRVSIIQAAGANPLYRAMKERNGDEIRPVKAETRATAIRIGSPASWKKAVSVLRATGGECEEVSEAEIAIAKAEIGSDGVGCEPASAVTLAGTKKLVQRGVIRRNESVVLILTGHLLKDSEYTLKFHRGELLEQGEASGDVAAQVERLRKPPLVLDASVQEVVRLLRENAGRG